MNEIKTLFKNKGLQFTQTRYAILKALQEKKGKHLSMEAIYDHVRVYLPTIGFATVYRNINLFEELQLVSKLNLRDGMNYYELNDAYKEHYHLCCKYCGSVVEVASENFGKMNNNILETYDFQLEKNGVFFYGICSRCHETIDRS